MSTLCLFVFVISFQIVFGEFIFPNVSIEAVKPKGLRVSVPYNKNVILFEFHANINRPIKNYENGEIAKEVFTSNGDAWRCELPDIELSAGDKIHYWAAVQVGIMMYRHKSVHEVTTFSEEKRQFAEATASCSEVIVNLTVSLLDAKENISSLEETVDIFRNLLETHPKLSKELILNAPPIKDDEVEFVVRGLIREKLGLNIKVDQIKKQNDGTIKLRVLTIDDKIAVLKAAKKKLKQSSFSFKY